MGTPAPEVEKKAVKERTRREQIDSLESQVSRIASQLETVQKELAKLKKEEATSEK
jgi:vacuolar-type H+-ATPase subunit I/STV1